MVQAVRVTRKASNGRTDNKGYQGEISEDGITKPKTFERKRKNWMKNKPCVCFSGRKFKNCCWSKYKRELLPELPELPEDI